MKKYVSKPAFVDAVRWEGTPASWAAVSQMCGSTVSYSGELVICKTLHGDVVAAVGDWIVKNASDVYPCTDEVFSARWAESQPTFHPSGKPTLLVDFDGVINSYATGWNGGKLVDPPVPGAIEFLRNATDHFDVCVYSSRSRDPGGVAAMTRYIDRFASEIGILGPWIDLIRYPTEKPAAFLTIDDRAVCFDGDWSRLDPKALLDFKPWNKL